MLEIDVQVRLCIVKPKFCISSIADLLDYVQQFPGHYKLEMNTVLLSGKAVFETCQNV